MRVPSAAAATLVLSLVACTAPRAGGAPRAAEAPAPPAPTARGGGSDLPSTSAQGSDVSPLPARHPDATWLPIEAPLLSMQLLVKVKVDGRQAVAALDTGAMSTTMSLPTARRLGVLDERTPQGEPVRAMDAHGDVLVGERLVVKELAIGPHRWRDRQVIVIGDQPDLFLIGLDVLKDLDLYVAADEGIVGLFPAGEAPREEGDVVVGLARGERQLLAAAEAAGAAGPVRFDLIVDTGAWNTSVPAFVGINGKLPADVAYESTTVAVGGEQVNRGRFVLAPLFLGPQRVPVGRVLAVPSTLQGGEELGLLGNDVFMRQHTVLSWARAEMRLKRPPPRPAHRLSGPYGARCRGPDGRDAPCIRVSLQAPPANAALADDDLPGVCMQVDVDPVYAGRTLELAVVAEEQDGHLPFNGGALRAFVTVGLEGTHACFRLWRQLERLGMTKDTKLSLRWVRTEGVVWPCDPMKTRCITFTGPLAKLPVK